MWRVGGQCASTIMGCLPRKLVEDSTCFGCACSLADRCSLVPKANRSPARVMFGEKNFLNIVKRIRCEQDKSRSASAFRVSFSDMESLR